ncbi:uncharacterized protein METZ01_LOCUS258907 [marine metagenome]|uniref:Uncharacterized protein n=1 Tax=marine metagenome TaxID=408172 RepID=A0A382J4P7_9ZZZZ
MQRAAQLDPSLVRAHIRLAISSVNSAVPEGVGGQGG